MKILVTYVSPHHHNTKTVLNAIANVLKEKNSLKFVKVSETQEPMIKKSDLVIFGSGIYFSKHHISLLNLVDKLPRYKNKKAAIISTSGFRTIKHHSTLRKKLIEKGFRIIDEFNCKGWDTFGPLKFIGGINKGRPNEKDLWLADEFARDLLKKARN
ncbi:flavodoxin [Candidatus Woesearchaeota archaeon]|nr:flavodoxin [Candidatus Woesearchaeota archaeon]